jgi:hypothetical protein
MNHEQLRQMTFRALDRVKQLGRDAEMLVFDREMDQWYANFLEACDPEQREEIEYHHKIHEMFES